MICSEEHAIFVQIEKGSIQRLDDGTFYKAGLSLKEKKSRIDCEPVAVIKKFMRSGKHK